MYHVDQAILVVVDVQGKLATIVHDKDKVIKHIQLLIQATKILNVPIIWTEQVPEKIGYTIPEIKTHLSDLKPIIKKSFSCSGASEFIQKIQSTKRKQIIIVGIETHVCIFQTVDDLLSSGYQVQVVVDAVSSRTLENKNIALERMKTIGCLLTSTEMIVTELLKTSEHPKFKEVLNLIR